MLWFKRSLPAQEALARAKKHLEKASSTKDKRKAQRLCADANEVLGKVNVAAASIKDRNEVASAYREQGTLLTTLGFNTEAQLSFDKANELSTSTSTATSIPPKSPSTSQQSTTPSSQRSTNHSETQVLTMSSSSGTTAIGKKETVLASIFTKDCPRSTVSCKLPEAYGRLASTRDLANSLSLLQASPLSEEELNSLVPEARNWLEHAKEDPEERSRLETLATDLIRALVRDELKDRKAIAEVVCLAPVLSKSDFRSLLSLLINAINDSLLQNSQAMEGLTYLIQNAKPAHIEADDLVKILIVLSTRLQATFQQSPQYIYESTFAVSRVLDAMALINIKGLDRVKLHEPLLSYLGRLKADKDPYMVYQAAYAYQALLCVPDDEEPWQAALRRSGVIIKGVAGLASAVKGLNVAEFINGLSTIQEGFQGAGQIIELAVDAYNGVTALKESGQGFLESLKSGLSFSKKRDWYAALRGADSLIQNGEMTKFKVLVCDVKAPCRRDVAFQWGLCQRLWYLAADPVRDDDTRKDAIAFLGEMYWDDGKWGQEPRVKQYILDILLQLSQVPEHGTKGSMGIAAEEVLRDLATDGDENKQGLYLACVKAGPSPHSWEVTKPLADSTSLIDLVQNKTPVEPALRKYQRHRLKDQEEQRHPVYISPQAKATRGPSDDDLFDLTTKVNEFIASDDAKVFLILGDSGAGKSTFNLELERNLWKVYETDKTWIPLFVPLPSIDRPEKGLIAKQLESCGFTEEEIRELKSYRQFILICDGYDECQSQRNLYYDNRLNNSGEWNVKMVISCRSEFLGSNYRDFFQPGDRKDRRGAMQLQEAVIAPFTVTKISEYIRSYVDNHQSGDLVWKVEDYDKAIKNIPNLLELVKNPFLLSLALEVLPKKFDLSKDLTSSKMSRVTLYDQFVEDWIEKGKKRLIRELTEVDKVAFRNLSEYSFIQIAIEFVKDLAVAIFDHQDGKPVVDFSPIRDKGNGNWKIAFFGQDGGKHLLREACPLKRTVNKHQFIHRSILEYGLARAVCEPGLSGELSDESVEELDVQQEIDERWLSDDTLFGSPLFRRSFVKEPSIINFLSERVQQIVKFKDQLHQFIERSKKDDRFSQAAANAITILVRAGVRFNDKDLRKIRVPGADLSCGDFDSAQLQGADLRNTILRNVWLHQADLCDAQMEGATFGEYPNLELEDRAKYCVFSPDGKYLTVGLQNGAIGMYDTSTWNKVLFPIHTHDVESVTGSSTDPKIKSGSDDKTLRLWDAQDGTPAITFVAYSPDGLQIVSGSSDDCVMRLWDVQTGALVSTFEGHTETVTSVAYSRTGHQIASGSWDKTIRLWDARTGAHVSTLDGHFGSITFMVYSPSGHRIASSSSDKTVRLWDSQTGALVSSMTAHTGTVSSVAYSPSGHQIASSSWDMTVRLWDAETGAFMSSLGGLSGIATSLAYSPNGHQIAASCMDDTVRLWDSKTGALVSSLSGHIGTVNFVTYLPPKGLLIASGSMDSTVRLWDAQAEAPSSSLSGHTGIVTSVACSPSGHQIISGGWDKTLRLWDAETGALISSRDHTKNVLSVAYSPSGNQIASGCGDKIVRLWDAKTSELVFSLSGHISDVTSVAYSPSGGQIASGSSDKTVRLWDTETGLFVSSLLGHTTEVTSVAYSPKGRQIASGSWDMTVRLWDAQTGDLVSQLIGHSSGVLSVAFSPGGDQIASGSDDSTVRLWDTQTGTLALSLSGHTSGVNSVSYSPSGRLIASGSDDDTVRLWDIISGQCLFTLDGFQDAPQGIAWKKDAYGGTYLVVGGNAKSVRTWKVNEDGDELKVFLHWRSTSDTLVLLKASIQGVQDISEMNLRLLQQRGAKGVPIAL